MWTPICNTWLLHIWFSLASARGIMPWRDARLTRHPSGSMVSPSPSTENPLTRVTSPGWLLRSACGKNLRKDLLETASWAYRVSSGGGGGNAWKGLESRLVLSISCRVLKSDLNFISNPNQTRGIISKCFLLTQSSRSLSVFREPDCSTYVSESSLMSIEMPHCDANSRIAAELTIVIICAGRMLV